MSIDFRLRLFLSSLFITFAWAGPLSTASLPLEVSGITPACAQPCLVSFISESFPSSVCSYPTLNCLCTSTSSSGFTLGEGALGCLVSTCPQWDEAEVVIVYNACSNIGNAQPNTHSIITATQISVATASVSTTSSLHPQTTSNFQSSIFNSTSSQPSSSTSSAASSSSSIEETILSASSTLSSSTPSSNANPPPSSSSPTGVAATSVPVASSASASSPILSKPQLAGVVVASVGAAALAFGLCFLLFCCRQRRRKSYKHHSGSSFGGDKIYDGNDSPPDPAVSAARQHGHDPHGMEVVSPRQPALHLETPANPRRSTLHQEARRNTAPQDIGLAMAPGAARSVEDGTPVTPASYRSTSQLLPEKPSYSLFPPPLRPSNHSTRTITDLEAMGTARLRSSQDPRQPQPDSRFPSSLDTSQAHMQRPNSLRKPSPPPPLVLPSHEQANRPHPAYRAYRPNRSEGRSTDMPAESEWNLPVSSVRKPLPAQHSPSARGMRPNPNLQAQNPSPPKSYLPPPPPPPPQLPTVEQHYLEAIRNSHRRSGSPRRKRSDPRPVTYLSTGSETSFEDADLNDQDYTEDTAALSPVHEGQSPAGTRIRYPPIPTSASESPTSRVGKVDIPSPSRPAQGQGNIARHSAKWKVLVAPGQESLNMGSDSPRSQKSTVYRTPGRTPPL